MGRAAARHRAQTRPRRVLTVSNCLVRATCTEYQLPTAPAGLAIVVRRGAVNGQPGPISAPAANGSAASAGGFLLALGLHPVAAVGCGSSWLSSSVADGVACWACHR